MNLAKLAKGVLENKSKKLIKDLIDKMKADRLFILSVISANNFKMVKEEYFPFLDNNGHTEYYDFCLKITDELLFSENSDYLKALERGDEFYTYFEETYTSAFDWFYIHESKKLIEGRLKEYKGDENCV